MIEDASTARDISKAVKRVRSSLGEAVRGPAPLPLGFRGLIIEALADDLARSMELETAAVRVPAGLAADPGAHELMERLLQALPDPAHIAALTTCLQRAGHAAGSTALREPAASTARMRDLDIAAVTIRSSPARPECDHERSAYDPDFWNGDLMTRRSNNCYNYAVDRRTDTFAQPGRGCGADAGALTCSDVTRAALCDGMNPRHHCFPDAEAPRHLVALVVWPGHDYHWYRLQEEGFWGHKPGTTKVRNVDNSGALISDPATCDRGPYSQFCGYFYTCRSMRIA